MTHIRNAMLVLAFVSAPAIADPPPTMVWQTVDGGGIISASGGGFELSGTIGQLDPEELSGGGFSMLGGFWGLDIAHCVVDFNYDGFGNGDDFDQFVFEFEIGLPSCDFDGNGFVNGDDFDLFAEAFVQGCE